MAYDTFPERDLLVLLSATNCGSPRAALAEKKFGTLTEVTIGNLTILCIEQMPPKRKIQRPFFERSLAIAAYAVAGNHGNAAEF